MVSGKKTTVQRCSKHPAVEARELCVRCGARLCRDCRLKEKKQPFCSSRCYRLHLAEGIKLSTINPLKSLSSFRGKTPALDAFALMVVLMLITAIHFKPSRLPEKNLLTADTDKEIFSQVAAPKTDTGAYAAPSLAPVVKQDIALTKEITPPQNNERPQKKYAYNRTIKTSSIYNVKGAGKKLSITFDGGSNDSSAKEILDVLKSRDINTTFFLTASFIGSYPETVKRMVAEGHEVGNHTFSHPHLTTYDINRIHMTLPGVDFDFIKRELDSTSKIFTEVTGRQIAPYWRAPYGEINKEILRWAASAGYRHISWTVDRRTMESMDSLDWVADQNSSLYLSSSEIKDRLLAFADSRERARGGIVLMHLGTERKVDVVHEKLDDIIDSFLAKGYELVPVSALLKAVKKS